MAKQLTNDHPVKLLLLNEHGGLAGQGFSYRGVGRAQGLLHQGQRPIQGRLGLFHAALIPQLQSTLHLHTTGA